MSVTISRPASEPSAEPRPALSPGRLVVTLAFAPVAAVGWVSVTLLGLAVRLALFREHRTQGTTSSLWGLGFALFLWAGALAVGLPDVRAIPFALVGGAAIALLIYLRGAALENPPQWQPGVFQRRQVARWLKPTSIPPAPREIEAAEQKGG
jgi:apolipoprotein N-acyltransferase